MNSPSTGLDSFGEATDNLWDFPLPPGHKLSTAQGNGICESEGSSPVLKTEFRIPEHATQVCESMCVRLCVLPDDKAVKT